MESKLIFMRRTSKEIEVFGGDVYIDINGRNIGILSTEDIEYKVCNGMHKIKMYKSHSYGSFIGHAEIELNVGENEQLLLRYSPPMVINQPGNIMVSNFKSEEETELLVKKQEDTITREQNLEEKKKKELEEKTRNGMIVFVVLMIISVIMYAISIADIYSLY